MNDTLKRIAATDNTVLITGRTGSGKSHLAKEIHLQSQRKNERFVAINLATLSENLIESELFGHEKGSFSGADQKRIGKLEIANRGTVFLDEIGELPLRLQTKLLEALNSRVICPVGSNKEIQLDVRIITATNRDLERMVRENQFREDLFFRVNTFQVCLPDLASEPKKIHELAQAFAKQSSINQNRPFFSFTQCFIEELRSYTWPGNVRELKNAIDFSVAMSTDGILSKDCLPPFVRARSRATTSLPDTIHFPTDYREAKSFFERTYLKEILLRFEGKINLTAKKTGLSKVTLIDKIRRYEIDIPGIKYQAHMNARISR